MSMCDNCIHDEVCGVEDNHDEAITFCANMIPKDILGKIRAEIADLDDADYDYEGYYKAVTDALKIIDKYKAEKE